MSETENDPGAARSEPAESEISVRLPLADAQAIEEALDLFAGIDEGENTDYENLRRLARLVREQSQSEPCADCGRPVIWDEYEGGWRHLDPTTACGLHP